LITLGMCRSVDCAAGQLLVRESLGQLTFCNKQGDVCEPSLDLNARFRIIAARCAAHTDSLLEVVKG
jgi:fructose-1,6-bisphosphatase/inositol monophosphatase family enzyme